MSAPERYLRLVKHSLLNDLYLELEGILHYLALCQHRGGEPDAEIIRDIITHRPDIVAHIQAAREQGEEVLWPEPDGEIYNPRNITEQVHTMIGRRRLDHLHGCLDTILAEQIPGDVIETGVWRGGATIFMRSHLAAHGVTDRTVWVADSFSGVPEPNVQEDLAYDISKRTNPILAISEERVRDLFRRYDLLDNQVQFLPGWFRDTLSLAPIARLALLRLDGDLYESTMDALLALYDKVSPGGFVIVDDYGALPPCRRAVDDFRAERGITTPFEEIDWTGIAWRKESASSRNEVVIESNERSEQAHLPSAPAAFTVVRLPKPPFAECEFYHTMETENGLMVGQWDLRETADQYLGHVLFAGKSVLEIGPASGFLTFHMEKAGARVTTIEPSLDRLWDIFPRQDMDIEKWRAQFLKRIVSIRNSFWYMHHELGSKVRLIETVPEAIPPDVGDFDIGLVASTLLHVRSPFSVLESVAARVRTTMVVTDLYDESLGDRPLMHLIPTPEVKEVDTWWSFTPRFFTRSLELLGFPHREVSIHHQKGPDGTMLPLFTVVAHR
jgi:O-methyltransferase